MRVAASHIRRCLSTSSFNPLSTIYDKNASVNAFVHVRDGSTPVDGENASATTASPAAKPLQWTTVAVKDNICTADMPTTCSSAMLKNFTSPFDATVVKLLKNAGADIVGKTNCDEFGMGSMNTHSIHGPVVNPFQAPDSTNSIPWANREKRVAGGSSGGSAAAVAADMCDIALATDTGGSIRLPASYCGVVGLKPSYGLISRYGVVSYADSLDCVGIMAKSIFQVRRAFDILDVADSNDPTSVSKHLRDSASIMLQDSSPLNRSSPSELNQLRIGVPREYFAQELTPVVRHSVRKALEAFQKLGAQIVPVSLPSTSYALSAYYVLASAEASSNLARYDGIEYGLRVTPPPGSDTTKTSNVYSHTRSQGFGEEVRKRILLGTYALTADAFDNYFLQAQKVRQLVRNDFDRVFRWSNLRVATSTSEEDVGVDVLIHPSAIRTAPPLSSEGSRSLDTYLQDVLTVPASLAGLPALNVPVPVDDGWPIGISIVGQWGCDRLVMDLGIIAEVAMGGGAGGGALAAEER
ncbi:Trimeric GatFAB AmidoTransferase(AdT) complex subunit [Marasmius crinis-equi]|uniref:Glutamyl-tRNA(Gln) amidotransferase subunit A, mitochondrial n=1 Tax=Marasmius crinis-equi TaxID=585013 RepID=A0ABR3FLY4_9AGAR